MINDKALLSALRNLGRYLRLRGAVLVAIDSDGQCGVVSWGMTPADGRDISPTGDHIADLIERDRVPLPPHW